MERKYEAFVKWQEALNVKQGSKLQLCPLMINTKGNNDERE